MARPSAEDDAATYDSVMLAIKSVVNLVLQQIIQDTSDLVCGKHSILSDFIGLDKVEQRILKVG